MPLKFVKPSLEFMPSFIDTLKEGNFSHMALNNFGDKPAEEVESDPQAYLDYLNDKSPRNVNTPDGKTHTFKDHYIIWTIDENNRFIAGISFRFDDNELINKYCGHFGMSVRPSLLNKGYGVKAALGMVEFAINEARKRDLTKLLASANIDNSASWRLLEHLNGKLILEHAPYKEWGKVKLYELDI